MYTSGIRLVKHSERSITAECMDIYRDMKEIISQKN